MAAWARKRLQGSGVEAETSDRERTVRARCALSSLESLVGTHSLVPGPAIPSGLFTFLSCSTTLSTVRTGQPSFKKMREEVSRVNLQCGVRLHP